MPTPDETRALGPLLAFGAHPDDIEFACGAVIARETRSGRGAHLVVCSRGEAASSGTPPQRAAETQKAAALLGASVEFAELGGDAHFEHRVEHVVMLAAIIRRVRPAIVLAPTLVENQHPDHPKLGAMVRDAARLARYGGVTELRSHPPHAIAVLLHYAITVDAEPHDAQPVLIDVSDPELVKTWTAAMQTHASQMPTRDYIDLQLTRARLHGARCGVSHAVPLFPSDPLVFGSVAAVARSARHF